MASAKRSETEAVKERERETKKKNSAYETTSVAATDEYYLFRRSATPLISEAR